MCGQITGGMTEKIWFKIGRYDLGVREMFLYGLASFGNTPLLECRRQKKPKNGIFIFYHFPSKRNGLAFTNHCS